MNNKHGTINTVSVIRSLPFIRFAVAIGIVVILLSAQVLSAQVAQQQFEDKTDENLKKISGIAEKLSVFPLEWVAKEESTPSAVKEGVTRSDISLEQFCWFYEFCDFAIRTSPEDVSRLVVEMKEMTPREKTLLMVLMYISTQPKPMVIPEGELEKNYNYLNHEGTWLTMMIASDSFGNDATIYRGDSEKLKKFRAYFMGIVRQYKDDNEIAFPAFTKEMEREWSKTNSVKRDKITQKVIAISPGKFDSGEYGNVTNSFPMEYHQDYFSKMEKRFPGTSFQVRSEFAYWSYWFRRESFNDSGMLPVPINGSLRR